MKVRS
jgi:hypothetical protein